MIENSSQKETSQVTYVTMVPRVGNETLRPLGVATGNAFSVATPRGRSSSSHEGELLFFTVIKHLCFWWNLKFTLISKIFIYFCQLLLDAILIRVKK